MRLVEGQPGVVLSKTTSGNYTNLNMRKDMAPGDKADFIAGMKWLINREAIRSSALRGLEDARILRTTPSAAGDPVYVVYHQRLREAAHEALGPAARRARQQLFAVWYERNAGDPDVKRRGAGPDTVMARAFDLRESLAEPDHDARHAAIANQKVRTDADDCDRDIGRRRGKELGKVGFIGRRKQHLRLAPGAKPGQWREFCIGLQPPFDRRQPLEQSLPVEALHQPVAALVSRSASCPGSA